MTIDNVQKINFEELKTVYDLQINDRQCNPTDIDKILAECTNLHWLSINHDALNFLPINLGKLANLRSLNLDLSNLIHLKGGLLPSSLTNLRIKSRNLRVIDFEDILHIKALEYLRIEAPITNLCSIEQLSNLIQIELSKTKLQAISSIDLPKSVSTIFLSENHNLSNIDLKDLIRLTHLYLRENKQDLQIFNISSCINLKSVSLQHLNSYPHGIEHCNKILSLSLTNSSINEIPNWILNLIELKQLYFDYTSIKKVPKDWKNLINLEHLRINNSEVEDFLFLYTIPNLKEVSFSNNPIVDSLFMLEGTKRLPTYSMGQLFDFKALDIKEVPSFMSALGKSGLSRAEKEWYFNALKDLKSIEITPNWSLYRLIRGLLIPYKAINDKILSYLTKHSQISSFNRGAICYLDGTFAEKKNEIKTKLDTLGIKVASNLDEEVTHIVLGKKPNEAIRYFGELDFRFITEQQLYQSIKDVGQEDKFLVQEAKSGDNQMVDSLKQLLTSMDANAVMIGLEMLKTGGIPENILEELVLLAKTFDDVKVRNEGKKILEKQGLPTWIGVLKDKQTFVNVQQTKDKEIRDKLEKMAKSVDKNEVFVFAMLLAKYYQKGFAYILANFPLSSDFRKKALLALTNGAYFDFHKGVGYYNWKQTKPEEVILSAVKTGISFPSDHPLAKEIKFINMHNCKFDTLSKDIVIFENVEELDLSVNNLKSLPLGIGKLKRLRVLNLSFNRLTSFPTALENLSLLKTLDLRYNSLHAFKSGDISTIEIPSSFTEKLPNCVVML